MLVNSVRKYFTMTPKQVHKMLQKSSEKIKGKQTVSDFENMHQFVTNSVQNNKLGGLINKTSRLDARFDSFMEDLTKGESEPKFADVSKKTKDNERSLKSEKEYTQEVNDLIHDIKRINESDELKSFEERYIKYYDVRDLKFDSEGQFKMMIMDQRLTTNTTSLRRINMFKALVWCGNMNGVVGYGKARATNSKTALTRAINNCKNNLVAINLDLLNTCPQSIYSKFGRFKIILWSRKYNNAWGNPDFGAMLQLAGLRHCMFKFIYDKPTPYNLVYCLMKLLTQNTTPKLLSEELGQKLYDTCWSRRRYKDYDMDSFTFE